MKNELEAGAEYAGYRIDRVIPLQLTKAVLYDLRHMASGARHIHIANSDGENTFGVVFKTVPQDSTGVAHILEHTVLCGSKRFPVRDPFFSMLKRSLSTFMNAFTASDWTMYPFSTQNRKDFYNLLTVYLDAAFRPKLDRLSFKQEGHRLEIERNDAHPEKTSLAFKGVVYNEMKGAMSSPDQVLARSLLGALFPDTTYRFNSGGDPAEIPGLTHEQLLAFHKRYYHPSNALFYSYGDLPLRDHLEFIHKELLSGFSRVQPHIEVPPQPRWRAAREASGPYPFSGNENPAKKFQVCLAWLTSDITDAYHVLTLSLLEQILIGNSASPLRKALIDSGLGSDLSDATGYAAEYRDTFFSCGLKDVEQNAGDRIEEIVLGTLSSLCDKGIDQSLIDSAIHQIEFGKKEITNTPYPYGLKQLLNITGACLHGGDPVDALEFESDLNRIRLAVKEGPFFENMIRKFFIDNAHRVRFTLVPDPALAEREENRVSEKLAKIQSSLSPEEIARIEKDAQALVERQNSEEDPSCLPTLTLGDISPEVPRVAADDAYTAIPGTCYAQPTSDIFYFTTALGGGGLENRLLPLVPFFCYTLPKIGTTRRDYVEMTRWISAVTGGVGLSAQSRTRFDAQGTCMPFVSFNGKCLGRNIDPLMEILQELSDHFRFTDLERLKQLLLQYRAKLESAVVHQGHRLAMSLASRNFSRAHHLSETWHGVHQLQTIKSLSENLSKEGLTRLAKDLSEIGRRLFAAGNFKPAFIGEAQVLDRLSDPAHPAQTFWSKWRDIDETGFTTPETDFGRQIVREGWRTTTAVSFVAQAFETVRMAHPDAPALAVIAKLLRSLYLHREIREKGGAYGGFAVYQPENGLFCFGSYRDPHILSTLSAYDRAFEFILSDRYSEQDVTEAVLQVCSDIERPDPPGPAARKAFYRSIVSLSDEMRQSYKEALLRLDRQAVAEAAERYFSSADSPKSVAVISNKEKLDRANTAMTEAMQLRTI